MKANLVPPKPFYNHNIIFKTCEVKRPKRLPRVMPPELPEIAFWPGVHYFGSPSRMFWMNGETTPYDGRPLYTTDNLTEDLAAGQLIVKAIRCNEQLSDTDTFLDRALQHVFAAVHQGQPKEDWLDWLCQVLDMIPSHPLNARGKPKKPHRGAAKPRAFGRAQFAATLPRGLKSKEVAKLWRDFKSKQ